VARVREKCCNSRRTAAVLSYDWRKKAQEKKLGARLGLKWGRG